MSANFSFMRKKHLFLYITSLILQKTTGGEWTQRFVEPFLLGCLWKRKVVF